MLQQHRTHCSCRAALALGAVSILAVAMPALSDPADAGFAGGNGLIVFASDRPAADGTQDFELYSMTAAGAAVTQLTDNTSVPSEHDPGVEEPIDDLAPAVSPNGRRIAFTSNRPAPDGSTDSEIYLMDLGGGNLSQVTDNPSGPAETNAEYDPAWSPDGTRLAFRRGEGRKADLWVIELANGREQRLDVPPNTGNRAFDGQPAWSPDGRRIAFRKGNGQGSAIWVYDLVRDRPFELIDNDEISDSCPSWSPDGGTLVYASGDEGGGAGLWLAKADGSMQRQITNVEPTVDGLAYSDLAPTWSPDGQQIAFQSTRYGILKPLDAPVVEAPEEEHGVCGGGGGGHEEEADPGNVELYRMNADGSGQRRLTVDDDAAAGAQDVTPDWQTIPRPAAALPSVTGAPEVSIQPITPSRRLCTSRRLIRIHVSFRFRTQQIASAKVFLAGRRVPVRYGRRLTTARVDLRGFPRGRYEVKVVVKLKRAVTVLRDGRRVRTRTFVTFRHFRTCEPGPTTRPPG